MTFKLGLSIAAIVSLFAISNTANAHYTGFAHSHKANTQYTMTAGNGLRGAAVLGKNGSRYSKYRAPNSYRYSRYSKRSIYSPVYRTQSNYISIEPRYNHMRTFYSQPTYLSRFSKSYRSYRSFRRFYK